MAIHKYRTRYGTVYHADKCKDNHSNMVTRGPQRRPDGSAIQYTTMTLQKPAMRSLKAVERDMGGPWKPEFIRVTGTIRSCEQQMALWLSDKNRFAHPDSTLHTQGLAIDVHTGHLSEKLRKSLLKHGWHQSRPVDEPWHFSFRLTA